MNPYLTPERHPRVKIKIVIDPLKDKVIVVSGTVPAVFKVPRADEGPYVLILS